MNERIVRNRASTKTTPLPSQGLVWGSSVISAGVFTLVGLALLGAALFSPVGIILKGIEVFLSLSVVAAGIMLWRTVLTREYRSQGAHHRDKKRELCAHTRCEQTAKAPHASA